MNYDHAVQDYLPRVNRGKTHWPTKYILEKAHSGALSPVALPLPLQSSLELSSRTIFIPVNVIVKVQPHWWCELASPAAEV